MHLFFIALSLIIYLGRGVLMLMSSPAVTNVTAIAGSSATFLLILGSGAWLAHHNGHGFDGFVITQFLGLMTYVIVGMIALKPGLTKPVAISLWVAGLTAFVTTFAVGKHWIPALF
jgi:uncharacterized membrane protein SirB2